METPHFDVLIVGAGQSGLQLGLMLQAEGYAVTIMSARTPDEIRSGWPTSTQGMFHPALETERRYGIRVLTFTPEHRAVEAMAIDGKMIERGPGPGAEGGRLRSGDVATRVQSGEGDHGEKYCRWLWNFSTCHAETNWLAERLFSTQ